MTVYRIRGVSLREVDSSKERSMFCSDRSCSDQLLPLVALWFQRSY